MEEQMEPAGVLVLAKVSLAKLATLTKPAGGDCRLRRLLDSMVSQIEEVEEIAGGVVVFAAAVCRVVVGFVALDEQCSMLERRPRLQWYQRCTWRRP